MQRSLIVQKYGGTSVGSVERIQAVAQRVAHTVKAGHRVVVVVSAMGDETDRLVDLGEQILQGSPTTPAQLREWDMLLSTGEQVSIALVALALQRLGCPALSLTAAQVGIVTTRDHSRARILHIHTDRLWQHLEREEVVVVAGFQGITSLAELEITTLGRGGSDTTAVALAVALGAELCEIYTDVPGIFTTDPRKVPEARLLPEITSDEMLELASLGAQVLHPRSVEIARNYGVKLRVRSSLEPLQAGSEGTLILSPPPPSSCCRQQYRAGPGGGYGGAGSGSGQVGVGGGAGSPWHCRPTLSGDRGGRGECGFDFAVPPVHSLLRQRDGLLAAGIRAPAHQ